MLTFYIFGVLCNMRLGNGVTQGIRVSYINHTWENNLGKQHAKRKNTSGTSGQGISVKSCNKRCAGR